MNEPKLLGIDAYEATKLRLLPSEKLVAYSNVSFIAMLVCLLSVLLYSSLIFFTGLTFGRVSDALLTDPMKILVYLTFPFAMVMVIYFSRSFAKLDRTRNKGTRAVMGLLALLLAGLWIGSELRVAYSNGRDISGLFTFSLELSYVIAALFMTHWWSIIQLLLAPAFFVLMWGIRGVGGRKLGWPDGADTLILRDDPDQAFYRGRVFLSTFGIPRIVDFVPHGQVWLIILFLFGYFCYSFQFISGFVYGIGLMYPFVHALDCYSAFYPAALLECARPLFSADRNVSTLIALAAVLLGISSALLGAFFSGLAQKRIRFSIAELTKSDQRRPILFLRAFKDDLVRLGQAKLSWGARLGKWLDHLSDLDRLLLQEGTPYGPVVAIGRPGDEWPAYCVARGRCDNENWRCEVLKLAKESMAIILCVDDTAGIWWEVEHVAARYPEKSLILVHPNHRVGNKNEQIVDKLMRFLDQSFSGIKSLTCAADRRNGVQGAILGFYEERGGALNVALSSTFSRIAFLIVVRSFFRSKWGLAP
jgi:hypothetical protein